MKFKVGAIIKRINCDHHGIYVGETFVVSKIKSSQEVALEGKGNYGYDINNFELISKTNSQLLSGLLEVLND